MWQYSIVRIRPKTYNELSLAPWVFSLVDVNHSEEWMGHPGVFETLVHIKNWCFYYKFQSLSRFAKWRRCYFRGCTNDLLMISVLCLITRPTNSFGPIGISCLIYIFGRWNGPVILVQVTSGLGLFRSPTNSVGLILITGLMYRLGRPFSDLCEPVIPAVILTLSVYVSSPAMSRQCRKC